MSTRGDWIHPPRDLSDEALEHIRMVFQERMAPKLLRAGARTGNLNCEFAGDEYKNWTVRFRSAGSGFEIVEFEYDEDGDGIDLDL